MQKEMAERYDALARSIEAFRKGMVMACGNDGAENKDRIASLDALRGLTVLAWLLSTLLPPVGYRLRGPVAHTLAWLFVPSFWRGATVYDLIVPMFVFVAGVSIVPALVCTVLGRNSLIVVLSTIGVLKALELAARFNDPGLRLPLNVASPACALLVLYLVTLVAFLLDRRQIYVTV
jgi:hypothetical protein